MWFSYSSLTHTGSENLKDTIWLMALKETDGFILGLICKYNAYFKYIKYATNSCADR